VLTFTDVAVRGDDEVLFASTIDEYADQSPDHCMILRYASGSFKQRLLDHAVARIVLPPEGNEPTCFLGTGAVSSFVGTHGVFQESLEDSDDGPSSSVLMRDARWVAGRLVACGMARMVYERIGPNRWGRIDSGVFVPRERRDRAVGFHAMAEHELFGTFFVGQYGEIWRRCAGRWQQDVSPTNVVLTDIACLFDGRVVVTGLAGTLLVFRDGVWHSLDAGTTDDLWSTCEFCGEPFVASSHDVYRITDGQKVQPVLRGVSAAKLAAGFGRLWSVGPKAVNVTENGTTWRAISLPST
jgi:hypothetical protein